MALPVYLALTEAEFRLLTRKPAHLVWMGIRFTESGTLVGFPEVFPAGGILTVNDSSPLPKKCPPEAIKILQQWVEQFRPSAVLMDMQRSGAAPEVMKALSKGLPCPVGRVGPVRRHFAWAGAAAANPLVPGPGRFLGALGGPGNLAGNLAPGAGRPADGNGSGHSLRPGVPRGAGTSRPMQPLYDSERAGFYRIPLPSDIRGYRRPVRRR